jgi:hypothetical protein
VASGEGIVFAGFFNVTIGLPPVITRTPSGGAISMPEYKASSAPVKGKFSKYNEAAWLVLHGANGGCLSIRSGAGFRTADLLDRLIDADLVEPGVADGDEPTFCLNEFASEALLTDAPIFPILSAAGINRIEIEGTS